MLEIKILGTGCPNCKRLEKVTREVIDQMNVEATVLKVSHMTEILEFDIVTTPGLVINDEIVSSGRVPTKGEIASFVAMALASEEE